MPTASVRRFAISIDPEEVVDFAEKLSFFAPVLKGLGFQQTTDYTWRYEDQECLMKAELQQSKDGYFMWIYVQAEDEHEYRLQEIAEGFGAHIVDRPRLMA